MLSDKWLKQLPVAPIDRLVSVSGGDINDTYRIESNHKNYFLKVHDHRPGNFFAVEAEGLKRLSQAARTPQVIDQGQIGTDDFLILEWIAAGRRRNERALGEMLARVHRVTSDSFGMDFDNFAGGLPQSNQREKNWTAFYLKQRIEPQIEIAKRRGRWNARRQKKYERFAERFRRAYRTRQVVPSLLHGDLWGGNVMYDEAGDPVLIDPSVFYGNREMDIAMTQLFGGFGADFYRSYNEAYPLDEGWQRRIAWYQLYYLLVHLNLFGEGYGAAMERALES
ncbi:MAG: fructosamine kinase family protein [Sporolactobacillus sp.]|jgi:fructosamine-3-kinase|nr:fructosamine kinase family protein [Sporolactobacillus sp.]